TGMRCRAVAAYPMYRGVSRLLGMEATEVVDDPAAEFTAVKTAWPEADFFFVHIKKTDAYGEDGDFDAKRKLIEAVDTHIPTLRALHPDVFLVTGDHSTPATLKAHSWHPVPTLLHAPRAQRPDGVTTFGEKACLAGSLGPRFPAPELMPLALGYAGRLRKFGA
ncbi:MAG: phosphoglycerate mutase, partial [Opitutales bacterium]